MITRGTRGNHGIAGHPPKNAWTGASSPESVEKLQDMLKKDDMSTEVLSAIAANQIDIEILHEMGPNDFQRLNLIVANEVKLRKWLSKYQEEDAARRLELAKAKFDSCAFGNWPIVNVISEALGANGRDCISDYETFDKFVQVIALLSGLSLSVVIGFPTSVSVEELDEFVERFDSYLLERDVDYSGKMAVAYFAAGSVVSFYLLAGAIYVVVIAYACSFTLKFSDTSLKAWWGAMRGLVLIAFVMMVVGCAFACDAFRALITIKFRDYSEEGESFRFADTYHFTSVVMIICGPALACFALLFSSFALYLKDNANPHEDAVLKE